MQETPVPSLVWEDPTCFRATKPVHNCWACALEPGSCNYRILELQLLKPLHPWAHPPQQEKPLQWEACVSRLESSPQLPTREKARAASKTQNSQKKKKKKGGGGCHLHIKKKEKKKKKWSAQKPYVPCSSQAPPRPRVSHTLLCDKQFLAFL